MTAISIELTHLRRHRAAMTALVVASLAFGALFIATVIAALSLGVLQIP